MRRIRSGVVLIEDGKMALIKRVRGGRVYYVVPGGGVEKGETIEQAAVREAREELGVEVRLERLLAVVDFGGNEQYYHLATVTGGTFGTGSGPEFAFTADSPRGSYEPVWMAFHEFAQHDVRPEALARLVAEGKDLTTGAVVRIVERI